MVFVKVRETYDLHTIRNKISLIGIHTPNGNIIKRNYPGLLMQCKMYRPVSCDVKIACASMLPLDPQGVGTTEGDVAPEDVFNPILYKAVSNQSMSQIEAYLLGTHTGYTSSGDSVDSTNDGLTTDDFNIYYGLLSNTHDWKHANPQSGLSMTNLRPLVYEKLYTYGQNGAYDDGRPNDVPVFQDGSGSMYNIVGYAFRGNPKPMPFIETTTPLVAESTVQAAQPGFQTPEGSGIAYNRQIGVPSPKVYCGIIIVPPSRLHQLFYRLVCEWTLEFTSIRPLSEITNFAGLAGIGNAQHVIDYDFGDSKVFTEQTMLVDTSEGSEIHKVM